MESRVEVDAGKFTPSRPSEASLNETFELDPTEWEDSFGKFSVNPNFTNDPFEYERRGNDPGLVVIFNFSSVRKGSEKEVEDIIVCLTRLGFNINSDYIFDNKTKDEIFYNVSQILKNDLSDVNSVLVFILTHGGHSNTLHTTSESFVANDLWDQFAKCSTLKGIPKMFVIQACKGEEHIKYSAELKDTPLVPTSTFSSGNIYPDMLILYSTIEGKYAFRDTELGSWLIQELCRNFSAYGRRDDVLTLLSRVSKCVCRNYYDERKKEIVKQVPVVVSTLSKKFYLNRNKDRHLVLTVFEKQDELMKKVQSISEKVKSLYGSS